MMDGADWPKVGEPRFFIIGRGEEARFCAALGAGDLISRKDLGVRAEASKKIEISVAPATPNPEIFTKNSS
jgi:hypothetical protein